MHLAGRDYLAASIGARLAPFSFEVVVVDFTAVAGGIPALNAAKAHPG